MGQQLCQNNSCCGNEDMFQLDTKQQVHPSMKDARDPFNDSQNSTQQNTAVGFCGLGGPIKQKKPIDRQNQRKENNEMIFDSLLNGHEFQSSYFRKKYSLDEVTATLKVQKAWRGFFVRNTVYPALKFLTLVNQLGSSPAALTVDELRYAIRGVPQTHNRVVTMTELQTGAFRLKQAQKNRLKGLAGQLRFVRQKMISESGCIYTGLWDDINMCREGYGIQLWPDGAKFEGCWHDDMASGQGRFILADGDLYEGEWALDKANGFGKYLYADGTRYEGFWRDDRFHGQGEERWTDSSMYRGNYENGLKNGTGFFRWEDGATYHGSWRNNKMHGQGIFKWKDGRQYQGEYHNDLKHGIGTFIWADGRLYEGGWERGKMHGAGKLTGANQKNSVSLTEQQSYSSLPQGAVQFGLWNRGKKEKLLEEGEYTQFLNDMQQQPKV